MTRLLGENLMMALGLVDVLKASGVRGRAQGVVVVGWGWFPAVCYYALGDPR